MRLTIIEETRNLRQPDRPSYLTSTHTMPKWFVRFSRLDGPRGKTILPSADCGSDGDKPRQYPGNKSAHRASKNPPRTRHCSSISPRKIPTVWLYSLVRGIRSLIAFHVDVVIISTFSYTKAFATRSLIPTQIKCLWLNNKYLRRYTVYCTCRCIK